MAKRDTNFLLGWVRQLEQELEDGTELAYRAAECVVRCGELVGAYEEDAADDASTSGLGADVDEMDLADGDGGEDPGEAPGCRPGGGEEALQHVSGLVRGMEHVPDRMHGDRGVPRGTGGRAPAAMTRQVKALRKGVVNRGA